MFRRNRGDETILRRHETIFRLFCRYPETALGYQATNETAQVSRTWRQRLMRTLSLILAFAFVLVSPSMAGSSDSLPAAGSFTYNGAPAVDSAPLLLAAR